MRFLITGGCGFIGSNFINYLLSTSPEAEVWNLDKMEYCAKETNVKQNSNTRGRYTFIKGDVCSAELVSFILNEFQIETVIHFAAQSHVDNSFNNSLVHTIDNVLGTHTLLEECRKYNQLHRFIHISTDEVYGESEYDDVEGKIETSILAPSNPYSASKAAAEMIVQAYLRSYKMPIIITRGNNVYGPNQYPEKLIPKFVELLQKGEKCTVHGKGQSIRSFIHVEDTCRAIDVILQKGEIGEVYNIGSDEEYSVLEIVQKLVSIIHPKENYSSYVMFVPDRNFNDKRYFVNADKLKKLGWTKNINFDQGILTVIN